MGASAIPSRARPRRGTGRLPRAPEIGACGRFPRRMRAGWFRRRRIADSNYARPRDAMAAKPWRRRSNDVPGVSRAAAVLPDEIDAHQPFALFLGNLLVAGVRVEL